MTLRKSLEIAERYWIARLERRPVWNYNGTVEENGCHHNAVIMKWKTLMFYSFRLKSAFAFYPLYGLQHVSYSTITAKETAQL